MSVDRYGYSWPGMTKPTDEEVDAVAAAIGDRAETYGQPGDLRAARPSHGLLLAQARAAIIRLDQVRGK